MSATMEPAPLDRLPVEVVRLVHAVDRMCDHWADSALPGYKTSERQQELWRQVHEACAAVWGMDDDA